MSTKENFLKDIKEVIEKYNIYVSYTESNGIPNGTINNIPNWLISAFKVEIPNEGVYTYISGKEFIEFMCK